MDIVLFCLVCSGGGSWEPACSMINFHHCALKNKTCLIIINYVAIIIGLIKMDSQSSTVTLTDALFR